jgi:hypothetical protein
MAWKPWYERVVEMHSAEEREEFLRGVVGYPTPRPGKVAGLALSGLLIGWGIAGGKWGSK